MRVEIDQSGKIEDTKTATVLALSNGLQFSIFISAVTKRAVLRKFRNKIPPKTFYLQLFVISLFILLRNHSKKVDLIIIDREYFGKEKLIKEHLLNLFRKKKIFVDSEKIDFKEIGKKSKAHLKALFDFRKNRADRKIETEEIIKLFK